MPPSKYEDWSDKELLEEADERTFAGADFLESLLRRFAEGNALTGGQRSALITMLERNDERSSR